MPTLGWIKESADDRYWENRSGRESSPLEPTVIYCPYCTSHFDSTEDFSKHLIIDHPIERPLLLINKRTALSDQTIRSPISSESIDVAHVSRINVSMDGGPSIPCSVDELKFKLSSHTNGHYSITLVNNHVDKERFVDARYIVKLSIADQAELKRVDELFIRALAIDDVRMSDVLRFSDACASYPTATEYASALAVYVIGVMIKDQNETTGVSQPFSAYKVKMQQAFETLNAFDRPIARAICAAIKFNLNDFTNPPLPSGARLLDEANAFFARVARGVVSRATVSTPSGLSARELPACPIDCDSYDILALYNRIRDERLTEETMSQLTTSSSSRRLSEYDLAKLRVLTAVTALASPDAAEDRRVLENLVNDPVFGKWAESQMSPGG